MMLVYNGSGCPDGYTQDRGTWFIVRSSFSVVIDRRTREVSLTLREGVMPPKSVLALRDALKGDFAYIREGQCP